MNPLPTPLNQLQGTGIIYLTLKSKNVITGFWYTSTVSCLPQVYILLFDDQYFQLPKSNSYGLTLSSLYNNNINKIHNIKLLSLKNKDKEALLRTFIYAAIMNLKGNNKQSKADDILRLTLEKLVVSSECSLSDYLRMIALLNSIKSHDNTMNNLDSEDNKKSKQIQNRISQATKLLNNYLHTLPSPSPTIPSIQEAIQELEKRLFDIAADVNI